MKNKKKLAWLSLDKMCLLKEKEGLGFCDLKSFNLVLLTKQGWRLQTNSTLPFRVYKAKYFPWCNFVEVSLGLRLSYAWQSLVVAQGVIRRGMRWQVGNGTRIRVWRDKWIPRPSTYKVLTTERPNSENALVCELINRATGEWNMDKLNSWFQPEDRLAIMYIPLSTIDTNDRLIWAENRSGKFTIKSAYALALEEEQHTTMGDCLNGLACRKIWKAIWHLNVPQKIKHFAWRASRDILATKTNLAKWKIAPSGICELCGKEEEMVNHLLWFCDHTKGVWMTSKFVLPFEISPSWNFLDVVENLQKWDDTCPGLLEKVITVF